MLGYAGCSTSNDKDEDIDTIKTDLQVGEFVKDVELVANQPIHLTHHFQELPDSFQEIKIDLNKMLDSISVEESSQAFNKTDKLLKSVAPHAEGDNSFSVKMYLGLESQRDTVCDSAVSFGPLIFTTDSAINLLRVDPPLIDLTQTALSIINIGSFHLCVEVVSPIDAVLNVVSIPIEAQNCRDPQDIDGIWSGTFACTNSCDPSSDDETKNISLTIAQNGTSAAYFDDEAEFSDTVCGNIFKFEGGSNDIGYTENGVFTLNADGTASKTSTWIDSEQCTGKCNNILHR